MLVFPASAGFPQAIVAPHDPKIADWYAEEVLPHEASLRAWLRARFPSLADPDDLLQETRLRLLRAHTTGHIVNTRAFLFATARNLALDFFRRRRVVTMEPLVTLAHSSVQQDGTDVAETVSRAQEIEILHAAIQALPERCREVMTLQQVHNLSNREIAGRLGISLNTVNAHVVLGLMRCRRYLRDHGVLRGRTP